MADMDKLAEIPNQSEFLNKYDEMRERAIKVLTDTGLFDHISHYTPEEIALPLVNHILSLVRNRAGEKVTDWEQTVMSDEQIAELYGGMPKFVDAIQRMIALQRKIAEAQAEIAFTAGIEKEGERIHAYLKALLAVNPKASLANTIDLIEATRPPGEIDK